MPVEIPDPLGLCRGHASLQPHPAGIRVEAIEDDPDGVVHIENAEFLARPVRGETQTRSSAVPVPARRRAGNSAM